MHTEPMALQPCGTVTNIQLIRSVYGDRGWHVHRDSNTLTHEGTPPVMGTGKQWHWSQALASTAECHIY